MDSPSDQMDDAIASGDRHFAARLLDELKPALSRRERTKYEAAVRTLPTTPAHRTKSVL